MVSKTKYDICKFCGGKKNERSRRCRKCYTSNRRNKQLARIVSCERQNERRRKKNEHTIK